MPPVYVCRRSPERGGAAIRLPDKASGDRCKTFYMRRHGGGPSRAVLGRHQTITDPAHRQAAHRMAHAAAAAKDAARSLDAADAVVERRELSVYDAAFGLTDGEVA